VISRHLLLPNVEQAQSYAWAANRKAVGPPKQFAGPYVKNSKKITAALSKAGLEPEAIAGVQARIEVLKHAEDWERGLRTA
jgi:hypothetical protein